MPNFATIGKPLRKLTRKHEDFRWESEQENTFKTIKEALVSAEVMSYYNPDAETRLIVDASPVGLIAILKQKQNGKSQLPVPAARLTRLRDDILRSSLKH